MKLCLIGSTRFAKEYQEANEMLTKAGHVVYTVATISTSHKFKENEHDKGGRIEPEELSEDTKETLDLVHLLKIINSDAVVLITDIHGYVGYSTKREIKWSMMIGKQVVLPNHIVGFGENLDKFYTEWLPKVLAERSGLDLHSKIKI